MAKDFKAKNIMDNFTSEPELNKDVAPVPEKRRGRPRTKDVEHTCKKYNLAIPNALYEQWQEISILWGGNFTSFVVQAIKNDLDNNRDKYRDAAKILQDNFK